MLNDYCNGCKWPGNKLICKRCTESRTPIALQVADLEPITKHESVGKKKARRAPTPCRIGVHSIRKRLADPDGISCKAVLDGLTEAGVIADDDAKNVKGLSFTQEAGEEDETIITIEFLEGGNDGRRNNVPEQGRSI